MIYSNRIHTYLQPSTTTFSSQSFRLVSCPIMAVYLPFISSIRVYLKKCFQLICHWKISFQNGKLNMMSCGTHIMFAEKFWSYVQTKTGRFDTILLTFMFLFCAGWIVVFWSEKKVKLAQSCFRCFACQTEYLYECVLWEMEIQLVCVHSVVTPKTNKIDSWIKYTHRRFCVDVCEHFFRNKILLRETGNSKGL